MSRLPESHMKPDTRPPSDHAALVVATATTMEMQAILSGPEQPRLEQGKALELQIGRRKLLLLVTGIGPINAALSLAYLLGGLSGPVGVLSLGVAGSFDLHALPLAQAVLVREEIWPEYGLVTEGGVDPRGLGLALGMRCGSPVWNTLTLDPSSDARRMGLDLRDIPHTVSLSVAGVTGTTNRADTLRRVYGADIENMEGFALAWTCSRLGIPFVQVRTVSNLVGSRQPEHWDLQGALRALRTAARIILREMSP